jgi:hypothetical protein
MQPRARSKYQSASDRLRLQKAGMGILRLLFFEVHNPLLLRHTPVVTRKRTPGRALPEVWTLELAYAEAINYGNVPKKHPSMLNCEKFFFAPFSPSRS